MIEALALGLGCGFTLSLTIGPVFFSLIQTSIHKGVKAGIMMAIGIMLSDSFYIFITYAGISSLTLDDLLKMGLGYVGGAIMLIFGITNFFKKPVCKTTEGTQPSQKLITYSVKGFALNGVNPFVFIYWIGITSFVHLQANFTTSHFFVYFGSIILVVFGTDVLKVFLASKLKHQITEKFQESLNKLVGIGLGGFGIYLIVMTFLGKV
ncbi:MAG TPA: LysE family translocator [Cytophagales bacterium]|nr:LysE family translocator [Cytophagales bacterium]